MTNPYTEELYREFARVCLGHADIHAALDDLPNGRSILGGMLEIVRNEDLLGECSFPSCKEARKLWATAWINYKELEASDA